MNAPIADKRLGRGLLDRIGRTPLLHLDRLAADLHGVEVLAKAEWANPGGSVKDRAASSMVLDAVERGLLRPGDPAGPRVLDATSGNTGIALAMLGAAMGFGVTLTMPENASPERKSILRAFGAEVILTPAAEGGDGAILAARRMVAADPLRWFYADQYSNPANWRAHYLGTGVEVLEQTGGRITHFVAGLGTTGTFVGTGRRLREEAPACRLVALQPDTPLHGMEGFKHLETAMVPAIYDPSVEHERRIVRTEDAQRTVKRLALEEGLLVGPSAGASAWASLEVARELAVRGEPGVVVTVFPDGADKYWSEPFWNEPE